MAKKKNKKDTTIDSTKIHPFFKYGISPEHLGLLAWFNFFMTGILYYAGGDEAYPNPNGYVRSIFLIFLVFTAVCLLVSRFEKILNKYQIFIYIFIVLECLITTLCMISIGLAGWLYDGNITSDDFTPSRVWSYLIPVIGLFIVSIVSFTIYHQNMVVLKLNKGRAVSYPISLGAIVSTVILGRQSSSPLSSTIVAIIGAIIGAGLFPGGAVGAIFCIIDLIKHPELKEYYE